MAYYINKDAIIEKIASIENETNYEPFTDEVFGKRLACEEIRAFIDTLEVKSFTAIETKKDLEKEAMEFVKTKDFISNPNPVTALAVHFYKLGLEAQKGK